LRLESLLLGNQLEAAATGSSLTKVDSTNAFSNLEVRKDPILLLLLHLKSHSPSLHFLLRHLTYVSFCRELCKVMRLSKKITFHKACYKLGLLDCLIDSALQIPFVEHHHALLECNKAIFANFANFPRYVGCNCHVTGLEIQANEANTNLQPEVKFKII
jgi:hypothetical protein